MYVPAWPGLSPAQFFHANGHRPRPFPLNGPDGIYFYFYRARNAIYHLFRALRFEEKMTVLVPAYHSGSEVLAIRAAGASVRYYTIGRNLEIGRAHV